MSSQDTTPQQKVEGSDHWEIDWRNPDIAIRYDDRSSMFNHWYAIMPEEKGWVRVYGDDVQGWRWLYVNCVGYLIEPHPIMTDPFTDADYAKEHFENWVNNERHGWRVEAGHYVIFE